MVVAAAAYLARRRDVRVRGVEGGLRKGLPAAERVHVDLGRLGGEGAVVCMEAMGRPDGERRINGGKGGERGATI